MKKTDHLNDRNHYGSHLSLNNASACYTFDPAARIDKDRYIWNIRFIRMTHEMLRSNHVNIKTRGFTFMIDAICIIHDHRTSDICMNTDVYPLIAEKHGIESIEKVEHNIRNAIKSAFNFRTELGDQIESPMDVFHQRPTPKAFLLHLTHEIQTRMVLEA
jgi:hypothetical protein